MPNEPSSVIPAGHLLSQVPYLDQTSNEKFPQAQIALLRRGFPQKSGFQVVGDGGLSLPSAA
jgi:hypothetical protein